MSYHSLLSGISWTTLSLPMAPLPVDVVLVVALLVTSVERSLRNKTKKKKSRNGRITPYIGVMNELG